ncbi:hypothetical protein HETIRDRAFT_61178 [Heterobasidion irregulare TC 32-1]|uniref:MYND-type domain-containing protein n=1 Tax=Heterobasidion irregulare (strain TC 32-1) TaxID=747525 RepID=W4K9A9_HETIT|nr:uncharacterized protein HETIRDRAFT_61178 [Heterobasidion irregulare TC 32-1]ETW82314.1 hypothetical protein HETIRDRAFT_61178 [Heterobasidion irregulare TC 32-1]
MACIGCTSNLIEFTDGVTWVQQVLHEGLLLALVNISPSFRLLDGDVCTLVLAMLSDRLPRYFVYRSVIVAASAAMTKLDNQHLAKIARSPLKEPWLKLKHLTEERMSIKTEWSVMRKQVGYCDNQGAKDTFKQCARCQTTMYCSKSCQVLGWKKGHKTECELKSLERTADTINRQDRVFMHHLAIRNARDNIVNLREIAARDHPGVPYAGLGVSCDYLKVPPTFGVFALENYTLERLADPTAERTLEARGLSLIAKVRASEGKYTLVESRVSRGETSTLIITISVRSLWEFDSDWEEEMNRLIDLSAEDVGMPSAWAKELTD